MRALALVAALAACAAPRAKPVLANRGGVDRPAPPPRRVADCLTRGGRVTCRWGWCTCYFAD